MLEIVLSDASQAWLLLHSIPDDATASVRPHLKLWLPQIKCHCAEINNGMSTPIMPNSSSWAPTRANDSHAVSRDITATIRLSILKLFISILLL